MSENSVLSADALRRWLTVYLATVIGEPSESIDTRVALSTYDLDSIDAVTMAIELEKKFTLKVHPDLFLLGHSSVEDVVAELCTHAVAGR
ncbi:phosphopantetheine-binding protein [Thiorhodococcus drewsii AZ1]|uniref:Phosphopantetheine-binding protein n=1 Tax=Thiorhodococcus drewsii AZ1 TaxID=765913 RepID=G2E7L1_9GAMM|nr:acyl carrier protein [Thiorhodococcus drewsii]EGV27895.1 phosphopantetheine-binding protein [Thiorhodococcus drewsii AZ1]